MSTTCGWIFATLNEANEAILRSETRDELYQSVCNAMVRGHGLKTAVILLADSHNSLRVAATASSAKDLHSAANAARAESDYGLANAAFQAGRAFRSHDAFNDNGVRSRADEDPQGDTSAKLAVPIRNDSKSEGVFLFSAAAGALTDEIAALLVKLAANVVFAINRIEQQQRREAAENTRYRLLRMSAALGAANAVILRAKTAEGMLKSTAETIAREARLLGVAIFAKADDGSPNLHLKAKAGKFLSLISRMRIPIDASDPEDRSLGEIAFRSKCPCVSEDVPTDPRMRSWWPVAGQVRLRACAVVPICVRRSPIAVMYLFFTEKYADLDAKIIGVLSRISENISFGLEMFEKQHEDRLAANKQDNLYRMYVALGATNEAIMRARTREEMLALVCEAAVLGGRFTSTTIALLEPGDDFLRIAASKGQNADRVRSTRFSISASHPEGRGLTGTSFRTKQPCIMNDFLNDKRTRHWHQLAEQGGTRAGASFPLLKKNRAIGVLLFLASERGVFTQDLVDLLGRLAENISFALANFDQADERLNADKQIHYLATHDGLTGLPNRLMFGQLLDRSAKTASRYNLKFAILFIDLDRFKLVNDSLGHAAGDELLKQVATRLVHSVRESDVVARLGGDEFVVLLQQIGDSEQAETIARKLLTALCPAITVMGHECRATASIGISLYPGDGEDADTLMKNADIAMYAAKDAGKNDVRLFSPHIKSHSVERFSLEADLRHALERNQFYLHYQPKLAVASGTLNGVEALIRWSHPDFGDLAPMTFIPLAEESGLIVPIGRWVLRTACAQNMAWQQQGLPPISVAVNLSPRQFLDDDLLQDIDEALGATSMPAHLLQLEITEGMVIQHVERAKALLTAIRCRGVRLAIDDFGIGYSSLSVMKQFPIDIIKIDRSFVQDLAASAQDRAIATAIINMGRALGVTVVAEGIETVEQDRFLRESLCDELQGFLFSKPLPPNDIAILLRTCASGLPSELAAVSPP